jgi:hypothetical protein
MARYLGTNVKIKKKAVAPANRIPIGNAQRQHRKIAVTGFHGLYRLDLRLGTDGSLLVYMFFLEPAQRLPINVAQVESRGRAFVCQHGRLQTFGCSDKHAAAANRPTIKKSSWILVQRVNVSNFAVTRKTPDWPRERNPRAKS